MPSRAIFVLVAATVVGAEDLVPPESVLLGKIRAHMVEVLAHTPSYTCIETMERMQRSGGRNFQMKDTLRLEVALVDGKEMFAWPGSKKFESDDLRSMITSGAYGNGSFALFARAIFGGNGATFVYAGEEKLKDRTLARYNYQVTRLMSGYSIRMKEHEEVVAYHGSFWAEPKALDVARLEVYADDIPPILDLASAFDGIDYARVRIGESDFLLPAEAQLSMQHSNGDESKNFMRFTSCRQYTGESVLRFDDFDDSNTPAKTGDVEIDIPTGLDLRTTLTGDLDLDKAAAGDVIHAALTHDLKQKGMLWAAKGSTVEGRITRIEHYRDSTILGILFTDLRGGGKHALIHPDLEGAMLGIVAAKPPTVSGQPSPHEALFHLRTGRVVLHRGILMYWRT